MDKEAISKEKKEAQDITIDDVYSYVEQRNETIRSSIKKLQDRFDVHIGIASDVMTGIPPPKKDSPTPNRDLYDIVTRLSNSLLDAWFEIYSNAAQRRELQDTKNTVYELQDTIAKMEIDSKGKSGDEALKPIELSVAKNMFKTADVPTWLEKLRRLMTECIDANCASEGVIYAESMYFLNDLINILEDAQ